MSTVKKMEMNLEIIAAALGIIVTVITGIVLITTFLQNSVSSAEEKFNTITKPIEDQII